MPVSKSSPPTKYVGIVALFTVFVLFGIAMLYGFWLALILLHYALLILIHHVALGVPATASGLSAKLPFKTTATIAEWLKSRRSGKLDNADGANKQHEESEDNESPQLKVKHRDD